MTQHQPQQVFVVHTATGPARTWVFHSRDDAVGYIERLATDPNPPRTTLTAGPLDPPPPPDPRTQVHLHWDGRILSTQRQKGLSRLHSRAPSPSTPNTGAATAPRGLSTTPPMTTPKPDATPPTWSPH